MTSDTFRYAFEESGNDLVQAIIENIPARWGRMPPLSRAVIVEAGRLLRQHGLLHKSINQHGSGRTIGLIGGTRRGSHATDIAFAESMKEDAILASPALFGYTLANIPLAEAANQFGLNGPVYAVIDADNPFEAAREEAQRLLLTDNSIDMMLACEFDAYYGYGSVERLSVTFTLLKQP